MRGFKCISLDYLAKRWICCQDVVMLVTTPDLVAALPAGRAVAAFNVITVEHAEAIATAAESVGCGVIMQLSENAIRFHNGPRAIAAAMVAVGNASTAPVVLHLDHITDGTLARLAAELGFSSVMFDGAHLPYEQNVAETASFVEWAHERGIWVEAELGEIGGKDGAHAPGVRTDPAEAAQFSEQTGVNALAVAVGSSHAMTSKEARLDIDLIERIAHSVSIPLVLHGSSGVPDDQLVSAARAGMRKINIGTALNVAFTGAVRGHLATTDKVDPRPYLAAGRAAMSETCAHYLQLIGK